MEDEQYNSKEIAMKNGNYAGKHDLKHLVIYCNPNPKSLSAAYKDAVAELSTMSHVPLNVRDLYNIGLQPVLEMGDFDAERHGQIPNEVKVEQDYILWADLLTFIYPVWWAGMPALMKGYIDRVFTRGFAYMTDDEGQVKGLLPGKKVVVLNNMGAPYRDYDENGMLQSMKQTVDEGIFGFCGMEVIEHRFFGHLDAASKEEREGHIRAMKLIYDKIWQENGIG